MCTSACNRSRMGGGDRHAWQQECQQASLARIQCMDRCEERHGRADAQACPNRSRRDVAPPAVACSESCRRQVVVGSLRVAPPMNYTSKYKGVPPIPIHATQLINRLLEATIAVNRVLIIERTRYCLTIFKLRAKRRYRPILIFETPRREPAKFGYNLAQNQ